jgi:hypothetical protein
MGTSNPAIDEKGRAFAGVPQVMWPVRAVDVDASLMGLVFQTAAENIQECTAPILEEAGLPHHVSFNLAIRPDLDEARLAHVIRLPEAEIVKRRYHPVENASGPPLVSFFGTPVALYDLHLRPRRVAPQRLAEACYHRAIWQHGLVPFDLVTGEWLVEACPRCGTKLAWYHSAGVAICDSAKCRFDLRSMCALRVDPVRREIASPICRLLDPDPAVHQPALAIVPDPIRELGRGPAFELIWRLGRASVRGGAAIRDVHKTLPADEIVDGICAGARLIGEWPQSLDLHIRRLVAEGDDKGATSFVRGLRKIGGHRQSWTSLRGLLHAASPQFVTTGRKAYLHATDDGVDGADARQVLRVSTGRVIRARDCKLVRVAAAGGETNVHAVFSRTQLEQIRTALDDRMPAGKLAERLGVSRHGVEQLLCLGEIDQVEETFVRELYVGLQLSSHSVARLIGDLEGRAEPGIGASTASVPLRRALMLIGGREKPWGPILRALRDGSMTYGLGDGRTFAARVRILPADVAHIVAMGFYRAAYPFDFSVRVNRRDAQDTLNLTPALMMSALQGELKAAASAKRDLAVDDVLRVARRTISGGEILARWGNGRRMPRQFRDKRRFSRLGATGWDRSEVEDAMRDPVLRKANGGGV